MVLSAPSTPLPHEPSWLWKLWRWTEDSIVAIPRIAWAVWKWVLVNGLYTTWWNLLRRWSNAVAQTSATLVENFSYKPFNYEAFEKVVRTDKFSARWWKRFSNTWKGIKNAGKFTGNTFRQAVIGSLLAIPTIAKWSVSATVWNALYWVKDLTNSLWGIIKDSADSIITIWDQHANKADFTFDNIAKTASLSYADAKAQRVALRAARKARRAARRAARSWAPAPAPSPAPAPAPAPTPAPAPAPAPAPRT